MLTPREHGAMVRSMRIALAHLEANPPPACCMNCENLQRFSDGTRCRHFGEIAEEHMREPGCPRWDEVLPF